MENKVLIGIGIAAAVVGVYLWHKHSTGTVAVKTTETKPATTSATVDAKEKTSGFNAGDIVNGQMYGKDKKWHLITTPYAFDSPDEIIYDNPYPYALPYVVGGGVYGGGRGFGGRGFGGGGRHR